MNECWWLYFLSCKGGLTYLGTAADVEARFQKHLSGRGARFTRINRPIEILAAQPFPDRSTACKAEYALKRCSLPKKRQWAEKWPWPQSPTVGGRE